MEKYDEDEKLVHYIMEPEEELRTLRFIDNHKQPKLVITKVLWYPGYTDTETAQHLGLTGGYGFGGGIFL